MKDEIVSRLSMISRTLESGSGSSESRAENALRQVQGLIAWIEERTILEPFKPFDPEEFKAEFTNAMARMEDSP